jgi:hypothetical protein
VLQVALAPAPVTLHVLGKIRRQPFVTAIQVISKPDFPSGVSHQSRFNEVMAQHFSAERFFSGQTGKSTTRQERRNPNYGIVPPIVPRTLLPEIQARGKNRAVETRCKLLDPPKQRFGFH